jgi:hypothetical protein
VRPVVVLASRGRRRIVPSAPLGRLSGELFRSTEPAPLDGVFDCEEGCRPQFRASGNGHGWCRRRRTELDGRTERDFFNGIVAASLLRFEDDPERLRSHLAALVNEHKITCVFARADVNMHIKHFPDLPIEKHHALLKTEPK